MKAASKQALPVDDEVRMLKTTTCPTTSGRSRLTYQLGCSGKSDVQVRLTANDGGGLFTNSWLALSTLQKAIDVAEPFTSKALRPYVGKSANDPPFVMAVLKNLGLVKAVDEKSRSFVRGDSKVFAELKALASSGTKSDEKPSAAKATPKSKAKKK